MAGIWKSDYFAEVSTSELEFQLIKKVKRRLKREQFLVTPLAIMTNPFYIRWTVLDFGCGSKPYESLFKNANSYIGIDLEASGHSHQDSKVDVFYDGKTIPFPDEHFDAVVCFEVLEHVFNIKEIIQELNRVLKPNGKLLISVPFAWDEHEVPLFL